MEFIVTVPQTVFDDAKKQLEPYGKLVSEKCIELIQNLAYEYRMQLKKQAINAVIQSEVDRSDFTQG